MSEQSSAADEAENESSSEPPTPPGAPPIISSHAAYFFLPLPETLPLPQGLVRGFVDTTPRVAAEGLPTHHLRTSIRIHQSSRPGAVADTIAMLFAVAGEALPLHDEAPTPDHLGPPGSEPPREAVTIAEVLVPFDAPIAPGANVDDALSEAFDRGLQSVRELQRALYLARREPISLVTREALPFGVPVAIREIDRAGNTFEVSTSLYLINANVAGSPATNSWSDEDSVALNTALSHRSDEGVFSSSMDFTRESAISLTKAGDYRSAVLFAATACEVMFDDLLSHMLWEEGERPEAAAPIFDSLLTRRVKTQFHPRLGGSWSVDTTGPLRDWFVQVAGVRNRAVHGGVELSLHQARDALNAVEALRTHLGNLVANQAGMYPRTALVLPGEHGLKRRRKWNSALDRLQHSDSEVPSRETFRRWRSAMQRARAESPLATKPSVATSRVLLVINPGGEERWVVHDEGAGMATAADPADVVIGVDQLAQLDVVRSRILSIGSPSAEFVQFEDATIAPTHQPSWLPEYRLVPSTGVLVNGSDLDPI